MAHSTPIFILSLLLLATISNACNTCTLPSPSPRPPKPTPTPYTPTPVMPATPPPATCPKDTLKLGACMDLLGGATGVIGTPASSPCCALLSGLAEMEMARCLCTAMKANVLGIHMNIPEALSTIICACGKSVPPGYKCE